jgi:outer membrane protein assembly factor BamE (lipoprotein component of BamABCDE complex)
MTAKQSSIQGLLAALLLAATAGCISPSHRINRYIENHPERPIFICAALLEQKVRPGMTPEEVRLCLGAPNSIEHSGDSDSRMETWQYVRDSNTEGSLRGSSLWKLKIPEATIYFSSHGAVTEGVFYNEPKPEDKEQQVYVTGTTTPESTTPPAAAPKRTRPRGRPAPKPLPRYQPKPDELGTKGWPEITLGGVSVTAGDRTAILNGQMLEQGEMAQGVTLLRVYANGALLEHEGGRTFLRPGETTK